MTRIATLPGDGIGPEVLAAGLEVLAAVAEVEVEEHLFGGASIDANGPVLPNPRFAGRGRPSSRPYCEDELLAACRRESSEAMAGERESKVAITRLV